MTGLDPDRVLLAGILIGGLSLVGMLAVESLLAWLWERRDR